MCLKQNKSQFWNKTAYAVGFICCLLVYRHSWADQANQQHSIPPISDEQKQQDQAILADYQKKLAEYHQGKRDDQDGYVILSFMLQMNGVLGQKNTPQAQALLKEYNGLSAKHPEFQKMQHLELSEAREQRVRNTKMTEEARVKAASFVPKDNRVVAIYGYGQEVIAQYQYKIAFYRLRANLGLRDDKGYPRIYQGQQEMSITQFAPEKTITFAHAINVYPFPAVANSPRWICTNLLSGYSANSDEERRIMAAKGYNEIMPWEEKSAQYSDFCGVVSLDGNVVYQLPIHQELPGTLIKVLRVMGEGKRAILGVGEKSLIKDEYGQRTEIGNFREALVWEYPNKLKHISIPTADPEIQKVINGM